MRSLFIISFCLISLTFEVAHSAASKQVLGQYPRQNAVNSICTKTYRCQTVASFAFESDRSQARLAVAFFGSSMATPDARGGLSLEGAVIQTGNSTQYGLEVTFARDLYLPICPVNQIAEWPILAGNILFEGQVICGDVQDLKNAYEVITGVQNQRRCMFPMCGGYKFGTLEGTTGSAKKGRITIVESDGVTPVAEFIFNSTSSWYVPDMDSDQSGM